jgi:uncharacterized membrane protein SpoIIM required for sporulation
MVLEKVISIRTAVMHPVWMFLIGGVVSVICIFLSFLIFPSNVGLFTVFLITFAMSPFMVNLMTYEEIETESEIESRSNLNFFKRHGSTLKIYVAFFAGMILALSIIFIILPDKTVEKIFQDQVNEINIIRGNAAFPSSFQRIIFNNAGVLFLSFIFAFLFGSGAVFILAWNASVLSAAIGLLAKSIGGIKGLPTAVLTFLPHGSFEIIAYFIAGIAGGLISAVIIRKRSRWFWVVVEDSLKMIGVAMVFLVIGALIESAIISF